MKDTVKGFAQRPPVAREHGPNLLRCHGNRLPHWPRLVPIRACRWRPLGREGREEGGGRRRRPRPVLSPRDHGSHLVRSPTWKEFPPTTGLPPRGAAVSQTHSRCQPGRPVVVPGDPECPVNSLRPARCPRKCWAAAKPRPAPPRPLVFGNCPEAPSLASLPPLGGPAARSSSPGHDATPRWTRDLFHACAAHGGRSTLGCTLSDLGMLGLAGGLPSWSLLLSRVGTQIHQHCVRWGKCLNFSEP